MAKARYTPLQLVRFWLQTPARILAGSKPLPEADDPLQWLVANAPAEVHDRRAKPGEKFGDRARARGARTWDEIEGITYHQTAVGPGSIGFDGLRKVPIHGAVDSLAGIHLLWDPRVLLWQANYLNDESIGIEVDCRAAGVEGDMSTVWRSKREKNGYRDKRGRWHEPKSAAEVLREATEQQMEAAKILGTYYAMLLRKNRSDRFAPVKIWSHRNGSASRTTDPGSRIYRGVMEPLLARPDFVAGEPQGNGKPTDPRWPTPEVA